MTEINWTLCVYAVTAFVLIGVLLAGLILLTKHRFASSTTCKISINDDLDLTKRVAAGCTLLEALTKEGIPIPSPCGGKATCKQCRVQVVEGAEAPLETDIATFSKKQLKEGWRLSCQTKVHADLGVHIEESLLGVKIWKGEVVSNKNVATFIKEIVVELTPEESVKYRSGGYLQFHVPPFTTNTSDWKATIDEKFWPDWEKYGMFDQEIVHKPKEGECIRAYSMASYPAEGKGSKLIFNIRIATPPFENGKVSKTIPWGICSSYAFSLKPGDPITLSGPYGESFMINDNRSLYFLIGGAGSSFGRSHILHLFRTEKTKRHVEMWYGARSLRENIYQEEYEQLAKEFENFSYHLVLSEPLPEDLLAGWPKDDPTKTNFLFRAFEIAILKELDAPEDHLYYVCGPPMHNKSVLKLLDDYGVPRDSIVLDDFGS
jgi:Na+-transporting NADH:ubiquinone oxidoreductase subunit F